MESVFALALCVGPEPSEDGLCVRSRLHSYLFDSGMVFEQLIPNVSGCRQQDASVVMMEDCNDSHIPQRLLVKCDPPKRPVADDFGGQTTEPHARNRLGSHHSRQLLNQPPNAVVF